MKLAILVVMLAACGGSKPAPANPTPPPDAAAAPADTAIHQRRDAACEALGPRLTQCAIDDAKARNDQEALKDIDKVAPLNTKKFIEQCESSEMSSRQVRVLEVCGKEAPDCAELDRCLANLNPPQ
ncbi:MAG TPA: hypothetical protein VL463_34590 [Kofleriaceae bacterium]|nr:hypothetical protein [Kofleriaceae bacterium]